MLQNKTATQKRIQKFFNSVQSKKVYLHTKQIVCKKKKQTNKAVELLQTKKTTAGA